MKFNELSTPQIMVIHDAVIREYGASRGHTDTGKIDLLLAKIDFLDGEDIVERSAVLLEGWIRLHPCTDGNKRTALQAVRMYLNLNGFVFVFPLSTIAFISKIANTHGNDPDDNADLIEEIRYWMDFFVIPSSDIKKIKVRVRFHYTLPLSLAVFFKRIRCKQISELVLKLHFKNSIKNIDAKMLDFVLGLTMQQVEAALDKGHVR